MIFIAYIQVEYNKQLHTIKTAVSMIYFHADSSFFVIYVYTSSPRAF